MDALTQEEKLVFIFLVILLASCTRMEQYRTDYDKCTSTQPEEDCRDSSFQEYLNKDKRSEDCYLGFVEFDDQGQLWDREQLRSLFKQLYLESKDDDLLLVVFVHGWKHSAKAGDENIRNFRNSLKRLSAMESAIAVASSTDARKIAGIYLGWRGGSSTVPVLKELTFWDRKNIAHKVGYGDVTEVLSRLEQLQKTKNEGTGSNRTYLVVVGHSFGGAVVYSALSEILENGFINPDGPIGRSSNTVGIGDLVVLINPAFEAMRYSTLSDMSTDRGTYFPGQLPVLAILTSEGDDATGKMFPLGRWFSTLFEKEREVKRHNAVTGKKEPISQSDANITAVGHFDDYITHHLSAAKTPDLKQSSAFDVGGEVSVFKLAGEDWEKDKPGNTINFAGSTLVRTKKSAGRNPYLNIRVDAELIPDHNKIYDPRIENFVRQLILIASQDRKLETRQKLRAGIK